MEFKEKAPRLGSRVSTPEGDGQVIGYNVPADRVTVKVGSRRCSCPSASVCSPRQQHDAHYNSAPGDGTAT
ncbi:hypothetical protein [Spirillospora sp. CA-128828]|uniref:hypothetical protein n=1 Tax=Spirillospora sp. CA-128828 TaxID=3240033 RepID=UPI003D9494A4